MGHCSMRLFGRRTIVESQFELFQEIQQKRRELDVCIKELRKNGTALAEAERAYKIKLREWCLRLRAQDMPIGLIDKTCYGIPEVADLRFARDVADVVYSANKDAVNSLKLQLRIISSQLSAELSSPNVGLGDV